jgi:hypothetical protein
MYKLEIVEKSEEVAIVHYVDGRGTWGTKGRKILFRKPSKKGWQIIAKFPFVWEDLFGWNRLASRALRIEKCIVYPTELGKLLGIRKGKVFDLSAGDARELFTIQGRAPLLRGVACSVNGELFFGEYLSNKERRPVNIWAVRSDLSSYRKAYIFPSGSIRHIHGLYSDPLKPERIWVTTGDLDGECYIWYSDDGFKSIERIGDGTQLWRAVGLLFTEEAVNWFTDTNLADNHFVSMNRKSMEAEILFDVDNSTLYSCRTTDGYYIASSIVEEGEFVKSKKATIRVSKDCQNWESVLSFEKDKYSKRLFGFGSLSFPSGKFSSNSVWLSGKGLKDIEGISRDMELTFK